MLRLEEENDGAAPENEIGEISRIELKEGGNKHRTLSVIYAMAAVFAVVFALKVFFLDQKIEYPEDDQTNIVTSVTENEQDPLPPDTAEVTVRVVDENGIFKRNMRIDFIPLKLKPDIPEGVDYDCAYWRLLFDIDEENIGRTGTIPMTYEEADTLRLHYGSYMFIVSDALANDTLNKDFFFNRNNTMPVTMFYGEPSEFMNKCLDIDENTSAIELKMPSSDTVVTYKYARGEIILQDAEGKPLYDYTVILKPVNGKMAEGFSDIYGGYVLPRTDRNGSTVWNVPIDGEYTVIAYREKLHTADIPVTEPLIIDGDDTFSYEKTAPYPVVSKTFKQAAN